MTHLWCALTEKKLLSSQAGIGTGWKHNLITKSCEANCSLASWAAPSSCWGSKQRGGRGASGLLSRARLKCTRAGSALPNVKCALCVPRLHGNPPPIILHLRDSPDPNKKTFHPQSIIYRPGASPSLSVAAPDAPLTPLSLSSSLDGSGWTSEEHEVYNHLSSYPTGLTSSHTANRNSSSLY